MAGRYNQPVQYGRVSAHKSWALGNHSSFGDYMFEIHHINEEENVLNEEENMLISGTRRSQQLEIPLSLNSKQPACFSSSAGISIATGISPGARILPSAWFSLAARISSFFAMIFGIRHDFHLHRDFTIRHNFWIRNTLNVCHLSGLRHVFVHISEPFYFDYFFTFSLDVCQHSE
jgi:hypothetical protein